MIRSLLTIIAVLTLGAAPALAVMFDHAAHLTYLPDAPCSTCHMDGEKEPIIIDGPPSIVPDRAVCLNCHDQTFVDEVEFPGLKTHGPVWALNHRPFAKGESMDCYACHQQFDCLECHKSGFADEQGAFGNNMINVHRSDFHVSHPIAARTDPQLCSSCHESRFCVECHERFDPETLAIVSHRRGWSDLPAGSAGPHYLQSSTQCQVCHKDPSIQEYRPLLPSDSWHSAHAREARKNLVTCQACHPEGDVCIQCHGSGGRGFLGINPHPGDWDDIKGRLDRASDGRTCRRCH